MLTGPPPKFHGTRDNLAARRLGAQTREVRRRGGTKLSCFGQSTGARVTNHLYRTASAVEHSTVIGGFVNKQSKVYTGVASLLLVGAVTVAVAAPVVAAAPGSFSVSLSPIPHDPAADGGSNVTSSSTLSLQGTRLTVNLTASGLSPNLPHLIHIHGVLQARNECPRLAADKPKNGGDGNGLIDTLEGLPAYGPILVTFSTSGDTSAAAGFNLSTASFSDAAGNLTYSRTFKIPQKIASDLSDLHVVIHGLDLNGNHAYDGVESSLGMGIPLEAELPVACGPIN